MRRRLLCAQRGVCPVDQTGDRALRPPLPSGPRALRQGQVLPEELALRKPLHRPLQAVRAERGGVRSQVLRQADDSLLRQSRLLPEEPPVLQCRRGPGVLPTSRQVQDPDPTRGHRRRAGNTADLLSARPGQYESRPLLSAGTGGAQQPRFPDTAPRHQPILLSARSGLWIGLGQGLRRSPIRLTKLRKLRQRVPKRDVQPGDLRPAVIASTLPIRRNLPPV